MVFAKVEMVRSLHKSNAEMEVQVVVGLAREMGEWHVKLTRTMLTQECSHEMV